MNRTELFNLAKGAAVTVKSGKEYRVTHPAYRSRTEAEAKAHYAATGNHVSYTSAPDGMVAPTFRQWQVNAKFPAGRFYGPMSYLKPENCTLVAAPDAPPPAAPKAEAAAPAAGLMFGRDPSLLPPGAYRDLLIAERDRAAEARAESVRAAAESCYQNAADTVVDILGKAATQALNFNDYNYAVDCEYIAQAPYFADQAGVTEAEILAVRNMDGGADPDAPLPAHRAAAAKRAAGVAAAEAAAEAEAARTAQAAGVDLTYAAGVAAAEAREAGIEAARLATEARHMAMSCAGYHAAALQPSADDADRAAHAAAIVRRDLAESAAKDAADLADVTKAEAARAARMAASRPAKAQACRAASAPSVRYVPLNAEARAVLAVIAGLGLGQDSGEILDSLTDSGRRR